MKKRISNRALALILALSVLVTAFAGAITTSALKIGELEDDFSSASVTEGLWKSVDSDTGSSVSGVTADGGFIKLPIGYKNITLFDNDDNTAMIKTDGRTLDKVSYYMDLTISGEQTTAPVIYYNPTTREYVHLILSWHKLYGWQVAYGVNGSGRISTNLLYNGNNKIMDETVHVRFDATYNYDANHVINSISLALNFYSDGTYSDSAFLGVNKATLTFTGATAKSATDVVSNTVAQISREAVEAITTGFKVGLRGGKDADNTNKIKVDKVEFVYSRSTDEEVQLYRARNAETLALTENTVKDTDLPAIATALNDYYEQKAATKTALAGDYALLIGMRQKLYKESYLADYDYRDVFDDFEGYSSSRTLDTIWTNYSIQKGEKVTKSAVVADEDGNKVLKQAIAGSTGVATVIDDGLWLNRQLKSFEFDYQMVDTTAGGLTPTFYTYIDNGTDTPTYTYFTLSRNDTYKCIEMKFGCNGFLKKYSGANVQMKWEAGWDISKPLHLKTTYTVFSATDFTIVTTATQGSCTASISNRVTNTDGVYRYVPTGAKIGFAATDTIHQGSIDNFKLKVDLSPEDYAFYFRNDNKVILARTAESIVPADRDAVVKALTDYSELNVESAEALKTEKSLLNQMAMKLEPDINSFLTKYGAMLDKEISAIDHTYDALIDSALEDYNGLSDLGKLVANITQLKAIKKHLVNLIVPVGNIWETGVETYSDKIDFENDYLPFVKSPSDTTINSTFEVCEDPFGDLLDPEDPSKGVNHVLHLKLASNETMFRVINSGLWPYKGQLTSLKFKVFIPRKDPTGATGFPGDTINASALLRVMYDYVDDDNYRAIYTSMGRKFGESRNGYIYYTDGEASGSGYTTQMGNSDLTSWVEYNMNYGSAAVSISIDWSGNTGDTFSLSYTQGAKIGFQMSSGYGNSSTDYYVDNIEMSFKQGDFDVNDEITDVNVYYTGNTFVHENETLMLTGEKLGNVVDKIEAYRLEDAAAGNNPTYIHAEDFQTGEVGEYKVTAPSNFVFDDGAAVELPIIQRTAPGVKAIIPEGFDPDGDGIYAVKVTAKNGTSKVMLINAPRINLVQGGDIETLIAGEKVYVAGWNILPTFDISKARVALKSVNNPDNIFIFTPDTMLEDDEYYYEFTLPADFSKGEYEMFLHSGFGGPQAWSAPKLVTVGDYARSSWPTTVFNVKDFGAVGDGDHNDTTAILNALNAAYLNGGGIVEFGRGIFRIDTTIPVPQKTVIRGVSSGETAIMFSTYKWQYYEAKTLFSLVGNCALENFYTYSIRSNYQLYANTPHASEAPDARHNVYIKDVMFRGNYFAGQTSGAATMTSTGKHSNAELKMILETENNITNKVVMSGITHYRIENLDMLDECSTGSHSFGGTNVFIERLITQGWTPTGGVNFMMKNCSARGTGAVHADNAHVYGCNWGKGYTNNREMFTTDGGPKGSNLKVRYIGDDPDLMEYYTGSRTLDECTYALVSGSAADDAWVGFNFLVTGGQGMGQMRVITANRKYRANGKESYRYTVTLNSPLTVRPNRNSTVFVVDHRTNTILVKNHLSEGSAGGIYGAGINWIFDMYDYSKGDGINLTNRSSIIWYITFKNMYMHDSKVYIHSDHSGNKINGDQTGGCAMAMKSSTTPCTCGMMGVMIKGNGDWTDPEDTRGFLDGYGISVSAGSTPNSLIEFVVEGMHLKNSETAFSGIATGISGVLIRNNLIEDAQVSLGSDYLENAAKGVYENNKLNSPKCIIYLVEDGKAVDYLLGDVNGDGKVTLKDVTLVRYHYLEISTGTTQQVARMDVNKDGKVTLRDANQIRRYVLGLISFHTFNNAEDGEESSSNPSSSNPSSSDPSSSNPSSSDPSSSNPSSSTESKGITTSEPNLDIRF